MFQEERHAKILEIIANEGKISTSRIQREFSVGYGTAKNDLDTLAEKGLIQRTHGGAIKSDHTKPFLNFQRRTTENGAKKKMLGEKTMQCN